MNSFSVKYLFKLTQIKSNRMEIAYRNVSIFVTSCTSTKWTRLILARSGLNYPVGHKYHVQLSWNPIHFILFSTRTDYDLFIVSSVPSLRVMHNKIVSSLISHINGRKTKAFTVSLRFSELPTSQYVWPAIILKLVCETCCSHRVELDSCSTRLQLSLFPAEVSVFGNFRPAFAFTSIFLCTASHQKQ